MIRYIFFVIVCFIICILINIVFVKLHKKYKTTHVRKSRHAQSIEPMYIKIDKPIDKKIFSLNQPKVELKIDKPTDKKTKKIDIIVPFRDRHKHFNKFKKHFNKYSKWDINLYVIEQDNDKHFNRAWLLNIGIIESMKNRQADCIVTSDVDIFGDVDYSWCDKPTQICSELDCHGDAVPYHTSAGGVVQANPSDWQKINGFTNKAEGWGGEDDDLHHRFKQNNLLTKGALRRPPKGKGVCKCLHDDDHTKTVRSNKYNKIVSQIDRLRRGSKEWENDGLNTLKYYFDKSVDTNVFWYKVDTENKYKETNNDCLLMSLPGYKRNIKPLYDLDTSPREDKLYQYNVYNRAITMAEKFKKKWIIDIGCGSGKKLFFLHSLGFNVVGIDFGDNIKAAKKKFSKLNEKQAILREYDLNKDKIDLPIQIIQNSIFISSDVIEHLINPDNLIMNIKNFILLGSKGVISTPDNKKLSNSMYPPRPSDVQVWSKEGFENYLNCHSMKYNIFGRLNNKIDNIINGVGAQFGSNIQPTDYFEEITIIIKTMNRYIQTNKFITSIKKRYNLPIIVVDDGKNDLQDKFEENIKYIKIPFDSGLSTGRNVAVENVLTKYTLVVDDDFLFTDNVDLIYLKNMLQDVDIVSGSLDGNTYSASLQYIDNILHICDNIAYPYNDKCYKTKRVLNLFLAKTMFLKLHPWDNKRKLQEHTWWFADLSKINAKIIYCNNFKLKHQPRKNTVEYQTLRNRNFKFQDDPEIKYCKNYCQTKPSGKMWDVFSEMVQILNELQAQWVLHGGNLLLYYRDCKLPHDDLDLRIDFDWYHNNYKLFKQKIEEKQFSQIHTFGTFGKPGYEVTWGKNGIKIDLFTEIKKNDLYISGLTIHKKTYPCFYERSYISTHVWNNIVIKIPEPVENVLEQMYGKTWQIPNTNNYSWNKTPFEKTDNKKPMCSKDTSLLD